MDSFHVNKLKEILLIIDDLGLEDETTSHTSPQNQTKRRGRKSHIPSVPTMPGRRAVHPATAKHTGIQVLNRTRRKHPLTSRPSSHRRPSVLETPRLDLNSVTPGGKAQTARAPNMVDLPCEDSRTATSAVHANTNTDVKAEGKQPPRHQCRPQPQVTATFTYKNFKPPTPASSNWYKKSKHHHSVPHPRTTHNPRHYPLKDIDQYNAEHYHRVPCYSAY